MNQTIGIQGGKGSYHQQAAGQLHIDDAAISFESTFADLFYALDSGRVQSAIVAIANNRYGAIPEPMAYLLSGKYIVTAETYVRVEHQLLGVPGAKLTDIKEVHSQAPALGQCTTLLHGNELPEGTLRIEQEDTAESARLVALWQDKSKVAVASRKASEIYNLEILKANIQDDPDNITRFLRLERLSHLHARKGDNKATILLTTAQKPGSLASALIPFKDVAINIESLHSTFVPNSPFEMRFLMDIDAGLQDPRLLEVFDILEKQGCTIDKIGSYMRAPMPHGVKS